MRISCKERERELDRHNTQVMEPRSFRLLKQGTAANSDPVRFAQFGHVHFLQPPIVTMFSFLTAWIMSCSIPLFTRDETGEMEFPGAKSRKCTNFVRTRVLPVSWVYSFGTLRASRPCATSYERYHHPTPTPSPPHPKHSIKSVCNFIRTLPSPHPNPIHPKRSIKTVCYFIRTLPSPHPNPIPTPFKA